MELCELGEQYYERARMLLQRIHALSSLADTLSGNEKILFKRRILSLYSDAAECRRCAEILVDYGKECKK